MARTEQEIVEALESSIEATDNTLDVTQGPIPDIMIRPQAGQLALAEAEAESLRQLFTLQFAESATEDEVRLALANYGSSPGEGSRSRHVQYFMRFTRPVEDVSIPAGTLVSNVDGSLVYRVVNTGTILASASDAYYNPSRNTYELGLLTEATGTGGSYELPKFRINTILTPILGIDSSENRSQSKGGRDKETKEAQAARLTNALQGTNLGAPGGITKKIQDEFSDQVTDVSVVQPFAKEFTRIVEGPALDVYLLGQTSENYIQTTVALAGQTQIVLDKKPVILVNSVTVNGTTVTFTLVPDLTKESGLSLDAQDVVVFSAPLLPGDIVTIDFEYNKLLEDVNTNVFGNGEDFLFNTDMLVRSPFPINPKIQGEVKSLPSYSTTEVENQITAFLETTFTPTTFVDVIYPEQIRQQILTEVPGIQSLRFTVFRRNTGALSDVEPIVLLNNESLVYDSSLVSIKVTR